MTAIVSMFGRSKTLSVIGPAVIEKLEEVSQMLMKNNQFEELKAFSELLVQEANGDVDGADNRHRQSERFRVIFRAIE